MNYDELKNSEIFIARESLFSPSLEAFRKFLLKNGADLTNVPDFNMWDVIHWGHPLSYISDDAFDSEPFAKLGKSFLAEGKPNANDFSEVQAIGLLAACGASTFEPVQRTGVKTNDFIVAWGENRIEVEVTRGGKKEEHAKREAFAKKLVDRLFELNRPFDLLVDVSCELIEESVIRLISAAGKIQVGEQFCEESTWRITGKPVDRLAGELFKAGEGDARPIWWPNDEIQFFALKTMIACEGDKGAAPRVKVRYSAPFKGYLNPAKKKAQRFQGSAALPYLVVLDANELPSPFEALAKGLLVHFPNWKHISGVLVFTDWRSHDEIGWTWRVFVNPHAARQLPDDMEKRMPFFSQPMNVVRKLTPGN